ncbi:ABC transporter ATP-binding protein [Flindersiella endophytica]
MRDALRDLGLWVATAWRAGPVWFLLEAALAIPHVLAPAGQAYGIKLVVDGLSGRSESLWPGVVVTVVAFAWQFLAMAVVVPMEATMNDRAYVHLHRELLRLTAGIPGIAHHEDPAVADRIGLLREQARNMSYSLGGLAFGLASAVNGFAVLGILGSVHPALLVLPVLGLTRVWAAAVSGNLQQRAAEESAPQRRLAGQLAGLTTSARHGLEMRVFGLGPFLLDRIAGLFERARRRRSAAIRRGALLELAVRGGFGVAYVAAIGWTIWLARNGSASAGDVALVVLLAPQVDQAATQIAANTRNLGQTARYFGRLRWLREYASEHSWADALAPAPPRLRSGIALRNVSFGYPGSGVVPGEAQPRAERPALSGVDLDLPAGSTVALVGENGAGKTTVVKLLARLYDPTGGAVLLDGVDLRSLRPAEWSRRLSAGFQDFARFEFAVRESVGAGDLSRLDDDAALWGALGRGDAATFVRALPAGLDTQLGKSFAGGVELSGGQWQRLALARAFLRDQPLLLLLDEPTAALDPAAEHALFERFAAAAKQAAAATGGITVLVSHRFSTVRMADLIVVLEGGQIIESGGHAELVAAGGRYAELFELQARAYR